MSDDRPTDEGVRLWVDLPTSGAVTAGSLVISGWAFRRGGARIVEVEARVGSEKCVLLQGSYRPDVALALKEPHADWCGFEGTLAVAESSVERADLLVVRATDELGGAAEVAVPVRVVPSGRPLLEVETARRVVDRIEVEGWLLWPGSTPPRSVALEIGGQRIATSTPRLSRPDVARRFPAFDHGVCRGFRLRGTFDPNAAPARLRVVATDGHGRDLEQSVAVAQEAPNGAAQASWQAMLAIEAALARTGELLDHEPVVLDWRGGLEPALFERAPTLFRPPDADAPTLPYLDRSVDLVVTDGASPERVAEARRVAAVASVEGSAVVWQPSSGALREPSDVSVVVPVQGDAAPPDADLDQLASSLGAEFHGELLIVDELGSDAASARLRAWSESWPWVRILHGDRSEGFHRSCNRAAALARGDVVVFLDGGARPRPAWLPPLLRLLEDDPSVGAVCGKLLRPDGTLDEAGRILFSDGSVRAFGAGDSTPNDPLFSFVRDVDVCSSRLLAVRRATFLALGGFATDCGGRGLEEADLSLRLRARGDRLRYQPESVVVRAAGALADGGSDGDPAGEAAAARQRFAGRWHRQLGRQPAPLVAAGRDALVPLSAAPGARRVLICAPRMPEFDRECGSQRLLHLVELMQEAGWSVSYLALKSVDGDRYVRLLQQRGVATFAGPDSLRAGDECVDDLGDLVARGRFELAIVAFWSVAETLLPLFRSRSPSTRVVVDSIDLHYLREERAALLVSASEEPAAKSRGRQERKRRELDTYAAADAVLTVSTREAALVERETAHAVPVACVPLLEELAFARHGFRDRSGLLFIGNFNHPPNLEGLEYLATEILPRLDPELLAAHPLTVVGNGTNDHVRAAVARVPHARVVGWVPSVVPYLESALVSLIPLLHGAGTKGKLIQALMVGTPSVSTSIGVEGLDLEHGRHVLVADSAEEFAAAIRRLTSDPRIWSRVARDGRTRIEASHDRGAVRERLRAALDTAMRAPKRRRPVSAARPPARSGSSRPSPGQDAIPI